MTTTQARYPGFLDFWSHIHAVTGISFAEKQLSSLHRRVQPRLRELGVRDYGTYLQFIREDASGTELDRLFDLVTVRDTAFLREAEQFDVLVKHIMPDVPALATTASTARIWSAGCATGEEAYSLALALIDGCAEHTAAGRFEILATDAARAALSVARRGVYSASSLRDLPVRWLEAYFERDPDGYRLRDDVRQRVRFAHQNLCTEPATVQPQFDVIFCRNVMIYFSQERRREVVLRLWEALLPGGTLFVGQKESLHDVASWIRPQYFGRVAVYRKPVS